MAKRSRRTRKQKLKNRQIVPTETSLVERGATGFKEANYDEAIKAWERASGNASAPADLPVALAEAYFRRALSGSDAAEADLQKATKLQPAEARYRYHLALTRHRSGKLDQAEPSYRQLLAQSPPFERAAEPLAYLLIEQKKSPAEDPVWEHLSSKAKPRLAAAHALATKKAASPVPELGHEPPDDAWRGLMALALNDKTAARQHLQTAEENLTTDQTVLRGVVYYYLGVLAADAGQMELALVHWHTAQDAGVTTQHLHQNLTTAAFQQALHEQQAGRPHRAAKLLGQANGQTAGRTDLAEFQQHLHWEIAYAAAQKSDWSEALQHWQSIKVTDKPDRKLLFNLALAYQHQERYYEAAEHWRQLLRRRPRKADHPDALNDEQVARIWQSVADNYGQAGDYEEAIVTYKNAVKWAPENVDLRLKLVDALQAEGRWQAAGNELDRILEKNPDNVQALTLLAESYSNDFYPDQARELWLRILKLEPQNPIAKQQLAHLFEARGLRLARWGSFASAIETFEEGLKLVPDNPQLHAYIGAVYADMDEFDETRDYFDRALALGPHDLQTLHLIFTIWLEHESGPDLDQTFERIKQIPGRIHHSFFIDLAENADRANLSKRAETILQYFEVRYAEDDEAMLELASHYDFGGQEGKAISILRSMLKRNSKHARANLRLGTLYYEMGQTRIGKRHWKTAETQAKKDNDQMLLAEIKMMKDYLMHGKPLPTSPLGLLGNLPPEVMEAMLKDAPPELAELVRTMDPEMLGALMGIADLGGFDDDDDDFGPGPRRK